MGVVPRGTWRRLLRDPKFVAPALVLVGVLALALAPSLLPLHTTDCSLARSLDGPSLDHPLGVDLLGCDLLTQVAHGARASLSIAAVVVLVSVGIAVVLGGLAGWFGGLVDVLISRATEVWISVPLILGGLLILSFVERPSVGSVAVVLALFGWPPMTRVMRSSVMQVREREFVEASVALGAGNARLLVHHVLPNALRPVLVFATLYAGVVIPVEATLTFLGVGLGLPDQSWGILLAEAQGRFRQAPHLLWVPAAALAATVSSFVVLGEALRDVFDPHRRSG